MDYNKIFQDAQKLDEVTQQQIVTDQAALANAHGNPEKGRPEGRTATQQTLMATQNFANKPSPTTATTVMNQIVGEKNLMKHGPNLKQAAINMLSDAVDFAKVGLTDNPTTEASSKQDATEAIESSTDANTTITDLNNDIQEDKANATASNPTDSTVAPNPTASANPTTTPATPTTTTPDSANPAVAGDATNGASDDVADKEAKQNQAELDSAVDNSKLSQENKEMYKRLSQKATDIQTVLNDYIKKFKADARITTMLNRYTGAEAKQQAKDAKAAQKLGESTEKLEEAKGGFKYHYKNFLKAAGKVRIWAIIGLALVVAGVAGISIKAISNAIKMAKNNAKAAKLTDETTNTEITNPEAVNNNVGTETGDTTVGTDTVNNTVGTETVDNTNVNTDTTSDVTQQDTDVNGGTSTEEVKEEIVDKPVEDVQPVVKLGGKTTAVWVNEQKASGKQIPEIIAAYEADGFSRLGPKFVAAMVAAFGGIALVSTSINPTTKEVIGTDASGKSYKVDTNTYTAAMITPEQKAVEDTKIEQEIEKDPNVAKEVAKEVSDETGGTTPGTPSDATTDTTNTTDTAGAGATATDEANKKGKVKKAKKTKEKTQAMSLAQWVLMESNKNRNTNVISIGLKAGGVTFTKHAGVYHWGPKNSTYWNEQGKQTKIPNSADEKSESIKYDNRDPAILAVKSGNTYAFPPEGEAMHVIYLDNAHNRVAGVRTAKDTKIFMAVAGAPQGRDVAMEEFVKGLIEAGDKNQIQNVAAGTVGGGLLGTIIGTMICPGLGSFLGGLLGSFAGTTASGVASSLFSNAASFCEHITWASMDRGSRIMLTNWSADHLGASGQAQNEIEQQKYEQVIQQAKQIMKNRALTYSPEPGNENESIKTALTNMRVDAVNKAAEVLGVAI